jgi:hypothetical protein
MSNLMAAEKNTTTEQLRCLVQCSGELRETDRADWGLTSLSFQSVRFPNRHVWVDTDLSGEMSVDLEDWLNEEEWDNAVARLDAADIDTCSKIIVAWLSGQSIEICRQLSGEDAESQ